jgi:hypothetical protein
MAPFASSVGGSLPNKDVLGRESFPEATP